MLKEFREFAVQGNMLDIAVGLVIGVAFGAIVSSLVDDILMPPVGLVLGGADFSQLFVVLQGDGTNTIEQAKAAGAVTLNIGLFINRGFVDHGDRRALTATAGTSSSCKSLVAWHQRGL